MCYHPDATRENLYSSVFVNDSWKFKSSFVLSLDFNRILFSLIFQPSYLSASLLLIQISAETPILLIRLSTPYTTTFYSGHVSDKCLRPHSVLCVLPYDIIAVHVASKRSALQPDLPLFVEDSALEGARGSRKGVCNTMSTKFAARYR